MAMPSDGNLTLTDGNPTAMILLELGKQSTQLAVVNTKLDSLISAKDDHEARLRALEAAASTMAGGKDVWARVWSGLAAAGAVGAGIAGYLHH